jgi:hypothetical protein
VVTVWMASRERSPPTSSLVPLRLSFPPSSSRANLPLLAAQDHRRPAPPPPGQELL